MTPRSNKLVTKIIAEIVPDEKISHDTFESTLLSIASTTKFQNFFPSLFQSRANVNSRIRGDSTIYIYSCKMSVNFLSDIYF